MNLEFIQEPTGEIEFLRCVLALIEAEPDVERDRMTVDTLMHDTAERAP